ncbi:MAG: glycosyltransferase family 2 protein [Burkholderiaceae bacterium]|nr:glycosyltransferase family 2 protein [Burkholderiaceae bacterium]
MTEPVPVPDRRTIDAIVTFHGEGIVAHRTLLGLTRVRSHAAAHGIEVRLIAVLDNADEDTREILRDSVLMQATDLILEVGNGDPGASRNDGVRAASADYIAIFDGDDYYSENWLTEALVAAQAHAGDVVVHPALQVTFGTVHCVSESLDMDDSPDYPLANCLSVNPWGACSFGKRDIYLRCPYHANDFRGTGFGYEDWHWNLEVVAHGVRHIKAPGTAHFYRRKAASVLSSHSAGGAILRPSGFFASAQAWWSALQRASMPARDDA